MVPSLRRRLIAILSASVVSAWLATAVFTYWDTKQEINIMLDEGLAQSAQLIAALLEQVPAEKWDKILKVAGKPQTNAFQISRLRDGAVLVSAEMPVFDLAKKTKMGFQTVWAQGDEWRHYSVAQNDIFLIEVAQAQSIREQLAGNVASHIIHPVWFALPLLAGLIWMSVRWGLSPLHVIVNDVKRRTPDNLVAIKSKRTPREILPLTLALNSLFERISRLLEKERRFTDDAAHELRTPLAIIKTHAHILREARNANERQQALDDLITGTDRAVRLVNQLLLLARLDNHDHYASAETVLLKDVVREAIAEAMDSAISKDIGLVLSQEKGTEPRIQANADLLTILFANLISNAVRYSPAGGQVTIEIGQRNGDNFAQVRDNGPGIAQEYHQQVFERFYRIAGNREEGCGLGLSIVGRIAEIYGLKLRLEPSEPVGGLCVDIAFPNSTL